MSMLHSYSEAKHGYILQTIFASEFLYINLNESSFFVIFTAWLILSDFQWNSLHNLYLVHCCLFLLFWKNQFSSSKDLWLVSGPYLPCQSFQNYYILQNYYITTYYILSVTTNIKLIQISICALMIKGMKIKLMDKKPFNLARIYSK